MPTVAELLPKWLPAHDLEKRRKQQPRGLLQANTDTTSSVICRAVARTDVAPSNANRAGRRRQPTCGACEPSLSVALLQEMMKIDECNMDKFGTLDSIEKTIAILGNRWCPQTAKHEGNKMS